MKYYFRFFILSYLFFGCDEKASEHDIKSFEYIKLGNSNFSFLGEGLLQQKDSFLVIYADSINKYSTHKTFPNYLRDFNIWRKARHGVYIYLYLHGNDPLQNELITHVVDTTSIKLILKDKNLIELKNVDTYGNRLFHLLENQLEELRKSNLTRDDP